MSKSSHEKLSLKSDGAVERKHKLARGGLALLLAGTVLTGAGCSGDKVGATAPEVNPSTTTESVAGPTETETVEKYTDQFADNMEVYKEMSVSEFENLPREERLAYADFLIDRTEDRGLYDTTYGYGNRNYITPKTANLENTGQEIIDINTYVTQMVFQQTNENASSKSELFNQSDARKLLSGVYYDVGEDIQVSKIYIKNIETINGLVEPGYIPDAYVELDSSEPILQQDKSGNQVYSRAVSYKNTTNGDLIYSRYYYVEYTSYDGKQVSTWLKDANYDTFEEAIGQ